MLTLCNAESTKLRTPFVGPYDAIHVGAAAPTVPAALLDQLAKGGRMFIPVGTHSQWIEHVDKDEDGNVTKTRVMGVRVRLHPDGPTIALKRLEYSTSPLLIARSK